MARTQIYFGQIVLRTIAVLLLAVFVMGAFTLKARAEEETSSEKYNRLKGELEDISNDIDSAKQEKKAAQKLKTSLTKQKELLGEMIDLKWQEIDEKTQALEAKEAEIEKKRKVIYENDQLFQERLVAIYKMNNATALAQLLNVDSFTEVLQISDALQRISQNDTELLELLNSQREALEKEQAEIDQVLTSLEEDYADLENNANRLAANISDTESRISTAEAEMKASKEAYKSTNEELIQAQKEMAAITAALGGSSEGDGSQYVGGTFVWPVPGYYNITCQFGAPDPNGTPHRGLDISGSTVLGASIVACGNGVVIEATYAHYSYGNYVVVDHGNGVKTLYAHCDSLNTVVGAVVSANDPIATVGNTGFSTGAHLHLEVQTGSGLQSPLNYLKG